MYILKNSSIGLRGGVDLYQDTRKHNANLDMILQGQTKKGQHRMFIPALPMRARPIQESVLHHSNLSPHQRLNIPETIAAQVTCLRFPSMNALMYSLNSILQVFSPQWPFMPRFTSVSLDNAAQKLMRVYMSMPLWK